MRLYLVRHGEAEPHAASDAQRPLTRHGRAGVARLWESLSQAGHQPSVLVSSPYVRAVQTADEIARYYPGIERREEALIVPDSPPQAVLDWLAAAGLPDGAALVSHMPLVALLTGLLVDGAGARVPFSVGTVACLDVDVVAERGARLLWTKG
jgi:phosphohistidine phosphatase